jgi:hypothetical protein
MQKIISTYQSSIKYSSSRIFFGLKPKTWLGLILSITISLILARRDMYIAIDDENYIAYFSVIYEGFSNLIGNLKEDWWNFLLNEPLWLWYSSSMGKIFDAESALRITIFFSSLMFMAASGCLTRGAWLFIFFWFVINSSLATQMYFNQIRQGLALSIFLTIITIGLSPFWGAAVASLVHSSFLFVFTCLLISLIIRKFNISWIITLIAIILSTYLFKSIAPDIDLGRRSAYEFKSERTIYYYLATVLPYGLVLVGFFGRKYFYDEKQIFWLYLTSVYFLFTTCLTFIHEEAGRMVSLYHAFLMIVIGLNLESKRVKIIALSFLLFILAGNINEARKDSNANDTFFDRWSSILK